jgi:hypothetical protein
MSEQRRWRCIQSFTPEFVAHFGEERLDEFVVTPDGVRPTEITSRRKLTDAEVLHYFCYEPELVPKNAEFWIFEGFAMSEQRFTDEQLDEIVRSLDFCSGSCDHRAVGAIAALRSRVSLLEGANERLLQANGHIAALYADANVEVAALRSQLDEARQTIKRLAMHTRAAHSTFGRGDDFKTSQHIGSALKELRRFDAALDGHHGEPK